MIVPVCHAAPLHSGDEKGTRPVSSAAHSVSRRSGDGRTDRPTSDQEAGMNRDAPDGMCVCACVFTRRAEKLAPLCVSKPAHCAPNRAHVGLQARGEHGGGGVTVNRPRAPMEQIECILVAFIKRSSPVSFLLPFPSSLLSSFFCWVACLIDPRVRIYIAMFLSVWVNR